MKPSNTPDQINSNIKVSCAFLSHPPTVIAPLFILGQPHGNPQADTGGAARDQHHFLPGTRHGSAQTDTGRQAAQQDEWRFELKANIRG